MAAWPQSAGSATAVIESLSGAVDDIDPAGRALRSASVGGYINYPLARYLGLNLQRFNSIRQKYDPTVLMRSGRGD